MNTETEFDPELSRAIAREQLAENMRRERETATARPFRFEDLNGKPEPETWGPIYPKTASAAVEKWRRIARVRELTLDEKHAHGEAVGDWIRALNNPAAKRWRVPASDLHYHKHHTCAHFGAAARAKVAAQAAVDKRQWAEGKSKGFAAGEHNLTIAQVYARAMAAKRARIAAEGNRAIVEAWDAARAEAA